MAWIVPPVFARAAKTTTRKGIMVNANLLMTRLAGVLFAAAVLIGIASPQFEPTPMVSVAAPATSDSSLVAASVDFDVSLTAATHGIATNATIVFADGTKVPFVRTAPVTEALDCLFCSFDKQKTVLYPRSMSPTSIPKGEVALALIIDETTGKIVVVGYSQGAEVAEGWQKQQIAGGNPTRTDDIMFVDLGGPGSEIDWDSPYERVVITQMYDGIADLPSGFNLLATANAIAGMLRVHTDYADVNLEDPRNLYRTVGNTTHVLLYTERLPLIGNLSYALGFGHVLDRILRPGINRAYNWEEDGYAPRSEPVLETQTIERQMAVTTADSTAPLQEESMVEVSTDKSARRSVSTEVAAEEISTEANEALVVSEDTIEETPDTIGAETEESTGSKAEEPEQSETEATESSQDETATRKSNDKGSENDDSSDSQRDRAVKSRGPSSDSDSDSPSSGSDSKSDKE